MVCLSTVRLALSVVVVLEFDSACWAVCDAHGLCSGEYLFSELFVFSGACSAHRSSSSCVGVRWWRVAASARRAPPPSNTTLFVLFSLHLRFSFSFLCLWNGGCRVVRAQPCEHARNTTVALVCSGFVYLDGVCVASATTRCLLSHRTLFVINGNSAQR